MHGATVRIVNVGWDFVFLIFLSRGFFFYVQYLYLILNTDFCVLISANELLSFI